MVTNNTINYHNYNNLIFRNQIVILEILNVQLNRSSKRERLAFELFPLLKLTSRTIHDTADKQDAFDDSVISFEVESSLFGSFHFIFPFILFVHIAR